jgi:hypothetical protein
MYQTTTSVWIPCFKFNSSSNLHLKNKNSWLIRSFIVPPTSIYFFHFVLFVDYLRDWVIIVL